MSADIHATGPIAGIGGGTGYAVTRATAEETAALRRTVLRPHLSIEQMALSGDQNPQTAYLAVRSPDDSQQVLGCLRLEPVNCPWPDALEVPAQSPWQLRAMATDPSVRGSGIGRLLVEGAVGHVLAQGGDLIWCNARMGAEQFYIRLGFRPVSGTFAVPGAPEAHVGMVLRPEMVRK